MPKHCHNIMFEKCFCQRNKKLTKPFEVVCGFRDKIPLWQAYGTLRQKKALCSTLRTTIVSTYYITIVQILFKEQNMAL